MPDEMTITSSKKAKVEPDNVLIVDDDHEMLDSLKDLLVIEGRYNVETATDLASIKKIIKHFSPDIALLDISLGDCNGLDLITLLKKHFPEIDCIMMTAHRNVDYAVKALRNGAVDYLFKPMDPAQLLQSIEGYLFARRVKHEATVKDRNIQTIMDQASGFIFLLSPAGVCIEASHAVLSYIGQAREEIVGKSFWELAWWQDSSVNSKSLRTVIELVLSGKTSRLEEEITDKDNIKSWYKFSLKPVYEKDREISLIMVEGYDLTEHKRIEQKLENIAFHDPLTGLANRTLLYEHMENALAHADRNKKQVSVIYIDLDHFKLVNDTLGHQAGDELLIKVAECLKGCTRGEDVIARLGGDEFVVILSSESDRKGASNLAERLVMSIINLALTENHGNVISASIGISVFPDDGKDAETLLGHADKAMYSAKKKGKNCFEFYDGTGTSG